MLCCSCCLWIPRTCPPAGVMRCNECYACCSAGIVLSSSLRMIQMVGLQVTLCNKDPREVERLMRPLGQGAAVNYHAATAQYL